MPHLSCRMFCCVAGLSLAGGLWHAGTAASASAPPPADAPSVTFNKDVAPIIFHNCAGCHHAGEVAPFALMSYADVKKHAHEIVDVTHEKTMPPWKPKIGYGDFQGVRSLTDQQIATLAAWSAAGRPEGNPADLPAPPQFVDGWQLGQPDLVVKMAEPYTLRAEGRDVFHVFVLPLNVTEDVYVSAVEFRPSNPKIVHHCIMFLDNSGTARSLEASSNDKPGYPHSGGPGFTPSGGLGGWAPGVSPRRLPEDLGRPIRKGADLVLQTHFHPSGKVEKEQSTIGIYFTKKPPEKVLVSFPKLARRLDIPAGESDHRVSDSFTVPSDVRLAAVFPHAHLLCKEIKVTATFPDGTVQPIIWIPKWDWDWQDEYQYNKPLDIPRGTRVDLEYHYDNSTSNPRNPTTPPRRVTWGEQTADEMAITFFQIEVDRSAMAAGAGNGEFAQRIRQRLRQRFAESAQTRPAEAKSGAVTQPAQ